MYSFFIILTLLYSAFIPFTQAQPAKSQPLDALIQTIEERRGNWTAFKANLTLHFLTENDRDATCQGELAYHRLDEKIILNCYNTAKELLFSFKTDDKHFQLYLPSKSSIYSGDIFDLEFSPNIDLHLKALDLYRALRSWAIPNTQSTIASWDKEKITLNIFGNHYKNDTYLSRFLVTSPKGDVELETFYSFEEEPSISIHRSSFEGFKMEDVNNEKSKIYYPKNITIESHSSFKETMLIFDEIQFYSFLENQNWNLMAPQNAGLIVIQSN